MTTERSATRRLSLEEAVTLAHEVIKTYAEVDAEHPESAHVKTDEELLARALLELNDKRASAHSESALIATIEKLPRIVPSELGPDEQWRRNGEYVSLFELRELFKNAAPQEEHTEAVGTPAAAGHHPAVAAPSETPRVEAFIDSFADQPFAPDPEIEITAWAQFARQLERELADLGQRLKEVIGREMRDRGEQRQMIADHDACAAAIRALKNAAPQAQSTQVPSGSAVAGQAPAVAAPSESAVTSVVKYPPDFLHSITDDLMQHSVPSADEDINAVAAEVSRRMRAKRRILSAGATTDTARLDWLRDTIHACPHAVITFNDDEDLEDHIGMVPLGFSLRIDGCEPVSFCDDDFRKMLDAAIAFRSPDRQANDQ